MLVLEIRVGEQFLKAASPSGNGSLQLALPPLPRHSRVKPEFSALTF
jgi:hypothetical protein